jgi:ubiquinone/menaquinone biosynthesis C-methylase UbiE
MDGDVVHPTPVCPPRNFTVQMRNPEGTIMGVYERWILPRLLDLAMRNRLLDDYRQRTIEMARGLVLKVGVGSGLNLPLYGHAVDRVFAIDTSLELLRLASKCKADAFVPVSLIRTSAEHLPFAVSAFDTIVMTWTLCSMASPLAALIEMRRVLKLGGRLLFVEHGLSSEARIARWQHWRGKRLRPKNTSAIHEYGDRRVGEHFDRLAAEDNRRDTATPVRGHHD